MTLNGNNFSYGEVGRYHFLGFIVCRDSFQSKWEIIRSAKDGSLEVSYRWFRTNEEAKKWCFNKDRVENDARKMSDPSSLSSSQLEASAN